METLSKWGSGKTSVWAVCCCCGGEPWEFLCGWSFPTSCGCPSLWCWVPLVFIHGGLGGHASLCVWTVQVPCLCLGVGEVSAALFAGNPRKAPAGLMNAPRGAPSPWRLCLIDGCHGAKRQIGNKERGVAPWHMPSIQHRRAERE